LVWGGGHEGAVVIWAISLLTAAVVAIAAWHFQRPRPPEVRLSFVRFMGALPPAPSRAVRLALVRPQDLVSLIAFLVAALAAIWALLSAERLLSASRPDHVGLRIVLDASHSMTVMDGSESRYALALRRAEAALAALAEGDSRSRCAEVVVVGARVGPVVPLPQGSAVVASVVGKPFAEGSDPARLLAGAGLPAQDCALSHVMVITDLPPAVGVAPSGAALLWDQVGAPADNVGLRGVALQSASFGQVQPEVIIEGTATDALPRSVTLRGPSMVQDLPVETVADSLDGRWMARAPYAGPGRYEAVLAEGGAYAGDDRFGVEIVAPAQIAVEWRLSELPRPSEMAGGGADSLLVSPASALRPEDMARPVLITYPGFGAATGPAQIGAFAQDPALLRLINLDALEVAGPAPWSGPLPAGFVPVLTLTGGEVLVARRQAPPGLIVPEPVLDAAAPGHSLSLTLFFSALADLAALPPVDQRGRWTEADGTEVAEAWLESGTARPLSPPLDLALLRQPSAATQAEPVWPWALALALLALGVERLWRFVMRKGGV
jgi:hypothetical protein